MGDEWTKLDYDNMAAVSDAIALGLLRLANSTTAPAWNPEQPRARRFMEARKAP